MNSKKPKSRITRFEIGRCYNLGNYQTMSFRVTVEVPEGESVRRAVFNTDKLLRAASPRAPVSESEYRRALNQLNDPTAWHRNITNKPERAREIQIMVKRAKELKEQREEWEANREAAMKALDNIGATKVFKDAKDNWGSEDYP